MSKTAVILAGGASRRFGSDKLLALFDGIPLIEHVVSALRPFHDELFIAGPAAKFSYLGLPTIPDRFPFQGPLHALAGIWDAVACDELLLAAGDMPFFASEIAAMLWEQSRGHDLTLIEGPRAPSPLPGIYSRKSQAAAHALLHNQRFSLKALMTCNLRLKVISREELTSTDATGRSLRNINYKEDL